MSCWVVVKGGSGVRWWCLLLGGGFLSGWVIFVKTRGW